MAEINGEEKRIGVSGEQIEEVVGKVPTIEADVKANKQSISALQTASSKHTEDIEKNTADIEKKANADDVYSREETDSAITAKVAEIVAGAPKEFDTLKEMSDWLTEHSDSAATMNTAIQANTAEIANNNSDILSAQNQIDNTIIPRIGSSITKNLAVKGWYRAFVSNRKYTSRNGLIKIARGYSNNPPELHTIIFNFGFFKNDFKLLNKIVDESSSLTGVCLVDKIRLVYYSSGAQNHECYIDIHYKGNASNSVNVALMDEVISASDADLIFKSNRFVASDLSLAEIPEGYTAYEFDLTGGDIFERLDALETALLQTNQTQTE